MFICEFWVFQNTSFIQHLRKTAISCTSWRISSTRYSKKLFHRSFQVFYIRTRSSHSKAFIYFKSLKNVCEEVNLEWSCEMPTFKLTKKTLSQIFLHAFCLHFLRILTTNVPKEALKVSQHNFFEEVIHLSQRSSCWIWHLTFCFWRSGYSFCYINRNSSFLAIIYIVAPPPLLKGAGRGGVGPSENWVTWRVRNVLLERGHKSEKEALM